MCAPCNRQCVVVQHEIVLFSAHFGRERARDKEGGGVIWHTARIVPFRSRGAGAFSQTPSVDASSCTIAIYFPLHIH